MSYDESPSDIAGYYSLSAHSMALEGIDAATRKKFRKYPMVPVTLLGRLARHEAHRKTGVGELLLVDALRRALDNSQEVGSHAVVVDAIDESVTRFYERYKFIAVLGTENRFYLPMDTIRQLDF